MTAMERIKEIEESVNSDRESGEIRNDEAKFLLLAFKVMREIAISYSCEHLKIDDPDNKAGEIDAEFEEAMQKHLDERPR